MSAARKIAVIAAHVAVPLALVCAAVGGIVYITSGAAHWPSALAGGGIACCGTVGGIWLIDWIGWS